MTTSPSACNWAYSQRKLSCSEQILSQYATCHMYSSVVLKQLQCSMHLTVEEAAAATVEDIAAVAVHLGDFVCWTPRTMP